MSQVSSIDSPPPVTAEDRDNSPGATDSSAADISPIEALEQESRDYFRDHPEESIESLGYGDESALIKALADGEAPAPSDAPAVEATPENATEETATPDEPANEPAPEGDDQIPAGEKAPAYRLKPRTDVGAIALKMLKSNPDMDEEDAFRLAREELSIPAAGEGEKPAGEPATEARSMADIRTDLTAAKAQVIEGADELDDEKRDEAMAKIETLTDEMAFIVEGDKLATDFNDSQAKVIAAYADDTGKLPAAVLDRMREIDESWKALGDERSNEANKAEQLINIVAREQNLAPRSASATPPENSPETPVPTGKRQAAPTTPLLPASGNAGSSGGSPIDIDAELESVNTPEDLDAFAKKHGLGQTFM